MKIDEECINHNAVRLITDTIGCIYEYAKEEKTVIVTLGEVSGILRMAEAMKEAVKA